MRWSVIPFLMATLVVVQGCESDTSEVIESQCGPTSGVVTRIVDGDTVELEDGTKIRYLGVNTPEITYDDCYSAEAMQKNSDLVLGKTIQLEYDTACTDRYGRLLAHVFVDDVHVNLKLLEEGYGCLLFIEPNNAYLTEFESADYVAQAYEIGVWGACDPVTCK